MKFFLVALVMTISLDQTICQEQPIDARLFQVYDIGYLEQLRKEQPQLLDYFTFCLDYSYYIMSLDQEKINHLPELFEINKTTKQILYQPLNDFDFNNINILKYNFNRAKSSPSKYKIGNTGKVIVFYPQEDLMKKYKESRSNVQSK